MTQDEIIHIAREVGAIQVDGKTAFYTDDLKQFAALVAQNYMAKACGSCVIKQCYKRMDENIEAAVLAEREACAKVCEEVDVNNKGFPLNAKTYAAAIRNRSNK